MALRSQRDLALVRLMLGGGLRPGEVLALKLEDISYGHRRVVVRCRNDHPKGVRAKSRFERVVDLYEPATLTALNEYVIAHRPTDARGKITVRKQLKCFSGCCIFRSSHALH